MEITASMVKELREKTNAGVMECKRALQDCSGNLQQATEILREQGLARAAKKLERVARQGLVEPYIHAAGRIGVLVELNCETDFVARMPEFKALAHDIAMQIAASNPQYLCLADVPADVKESNSPEAVAEMCLLSQPFIREPGLSIEKLITAKVAAVGENIRVSRYVRFELGVYQ
jgi:elongation factor Ts